MPLARHAPPPAWRAVLCPCVYACVDMCTPCRVCHALPHINMGICTPRRVSCVYVCTCTPCRVCHAPAHMMPRVYSAMYTVPCVSSSPRNEREHGARSRVMPILMWYAFNELTLILQRGKVPRPRDLKLYKRFIYFQNCRKGFEESKNNIQNSIHFEYSFLRIVAR